MNLGEVVSLHKQGKSKMAEEGYMGVLNSDPDNARALYLLGIIYMEQKKPGLASVLFRQALSLDAGMFSAWNSLGNAYNVMLKEKDAKTCWEKALTIKGRHPIDYADIYNNLATQFINSGEPEKGEYYIEKCLELHPGHEDGHWNKALIMLEQGKYGEGFDLYEWGFKNRNRIHREYGGGIPYWDGSEGKTIVVWGEQGIGDEIMYANMIPDLMKISKKVIFDCHPRLVKIFEASFSNLTVYGTRKDAYINWPYDHKDINARVCIGDLGRYFRRSLEDFPKHEGYLKANVDRIAHYRKKLDRISDRPKIGISWEGGYVKTRKDYRSIPLMKWEPILRQDADFISLQYTPEAYTEVAEVEDKLDLKIHHWPYAVQTYDYHETAALVSALDMVITVNTSIHHLSGALGKPTWTLTPKAKAWRYYSPDGVSFPWYPSVKCIQQPVIMEWDETMKNIGDELGFIFQKAEVTA